MTDDNPYFAEIDESSRRSFIKRGTLASSGLALGITGTGTTVSKPNEDQETTDQTQLNLADVTFLQLMAYHHRGAVEIAALAEERTNRDELISFAEEAIDHQQQEIEQIERILSDAGIEPGDVLNRDLDDVRGLVASIPGQPEANEIAYLETLTDEQFDLRFIELFTYHHSGAIQLSRRVLAEGQSPEVAGLAEDIIEMQLGEIIQMYEWYLQWVM